MNKNKVKKSYDIIPLQIFIIAWVTICVLFALLPLFITVVNSLKDTFHIQKNIFALPSGELFANAGKNFSEAWEVVKNSALRSIIVSLIGAFGDCLLGSILAYVFTTKKFPFKEAIFMTFISVMLLPSIMGMPILVPFVKNTLNLGDTFTGYLLPNFAGGQITCMFMFRIFFGQQPSAIYESARIEGASDPVIYAKITVPLAIPIILFQFVGCFGSLYNDYLWPSLLFTRKMTLIPIMLDAQSNFIKSGKNGAMYAMYIISSVPLIFTSIISMKYFSGGDFAAGMKL